MSFQILLVNLFLLFGQLCFAQEEIIVKSDVGNSDVIIPYLDQLQESKIEVVTDSGIVMEEIGIEAHYTEKTDALRKFVVQYLTYPQQAMNKGTQGNMVIKFIVEKDGTLSNFTIINLIGDGCEEEVIRILQLTSGKWTAAKINNKTVRSYYRLPITLRLAK